MNTLKILCLHGYGQTSAKFMHSFQGFWNRLRDLGCHLYFPEAIHSVSPFSGGEGKGWFTVSPNDKILGLQANDFFESKCYLGVDESVSNLEEFIENNGSFDGIIGYSQGGVMATILNGLNKISVKFMILVGIYPVTDEKLLDLKIYDNIEIPVLGIYGIKDDVVLSEYSKDAYLHIKNSEVHTHNGGHVIQYNKKLKIKYTEFLLRFKN